MCFPMAQTLVGLKWEIKLADFSFETGQAAIHTDANFNEMNNFEDKLGLILTVPVFTSVRVVSMWHNQK